VVRGLRVPLVGRISSDALALDVTDVPGFTVDDEVALLDPADVAAMTVHDLATLRGTIAWEVLDAFAPRLARVYTDAGRPVAVRYLDGATRFGDGW
jgi:alanine racemase